MSEDPPEVSDGKRTPEGTDLDAYVLVVVHRVNLIMKYIHQEVSLIPTGTVDGHSQFPLV